MVGYPDVDRGHRFAQSCRDALVGVTRLRYSARVVARQAHCCGVVRTRVQDPEGSVAHGEPRRPSSSLDSGGGARGTLRELSCHRQFPRVRTENIFGLGKRIITLEPNALKFLVPNQLFGSRSEIDSSNLGSTSITHGDLFFGHKRIAGCSRPRLSPESIQSRHTAGASALWLRRQQLQTHLPAGTAHSLIEREEFESRDRRPRHKCGCHVNRIERAGRLTGKGPAGAIDDLGRDA